MQFRNVMIGILLVKRYGRIETTIDTAIATISIKSVTMNMFY